jgi:alkylation response protein AidB-like acyl-CoA dehydrogenase
MIAPEPRSLNNKENAMAVLDSPPLRDPSLQRATLLTDEMLARFDARAEGYDRENRFFHEDFEELRASGYLLAAVPVDRGGFGLSLAEVMRLQQRLAYAAPATAVAVNMHLYWTGVAADMLALGDDRCAWILDEAAAGHVFAAGHGEHGNDAALFASTTIAERVEGGWRLHGRKVFGSLSPVWTYLGFHAMDMSDPANPRVIHGFLPRDASGYRIEETWDSLGMRATTSHDTVFDGAFVADEHVPVVAAAGPQGAELFHLAVMAWALLGFANVYTGIAHRAFDLTIESARSKQTLSLTRTVAHHPEVQHAVADMQISLDAIDAYLERVCQDWSAGVPHGERWASKIVAAKHFAVTQAFTVVDTALDIAGGAGVSRRNPLERLFRDARLGRVHPANRVDTYEIVGKAALGVVEDGGRRWG